MSMREKDAGRKTKEIQTGRERNRRDIVPPRRMVCERAQVLPLMESQARGQWGLGVMGSAGAM